jgi:hypothetical protein
MQFKSIGLMKLFGSAAAIVLFLLGSLPAVAQAQSPPQLVNYDRAGFLISWQQGGGGPATEVRVKCGAVSKVYTFTGSLQIAGLISPYLIPINVLPSTGKWFCAATAANVVGAQQLESGPTAEIVIDAEKGPLDPGLTVQ